MLTLVQLFSQLHLQAPFTHPLVEKIVASAMAPKGATSKRPAPADADATGSAAADKKPKSDSIVDAMVTAPGGWDSPPPPPPPPADLPEGTLGLCTICKKIVLEFGHPDAVPTVVFHVNHRTYYQHTHCRKALFDNWGRP